MTDKIESKLGSVDEAKRETIRKLVRTAAFMAPVVATFAIDGNLNKALSGSLAVSNS